MSRIRIALVEDDPDLRELLIRQIGRSPGLKLVAAYSSAEEALKGIVKDAPQVVLMDIGLPGMNGIECTRQLIKLRSEINVVILTERENTELIFQALKAGANGYLLRNQCNPAEIESAIREVQCGGSPMTPQVARKVVKHFKGTTEATGIETLTKREYEVLRCLAEGPLNKEIADQLGISMNTLRKHLKSIYRKLHAGSRTEAVSKYLRGRP